ncbi:MAG TPA: helix-turn-helix domain-containing protein [Gaiellales bacterium]|jgi:DNA-binding transcriptional ArsR family regulator|nr:helix-turn-helix domain-containing protein [Gaiellales bacterium]
MSFDEAQDPNHAAPFPSRELTDPRSLRAMAHPTRLDLLELLAREGALTATAAGAALGLSAANCSYHLRQLAKYGFVEEVPGGGPGRNRPWRAVDLSHRWSESSGSPATDQAAQTLSQIVWERVTLRLAEWLAHQDEEPAEWRDAAFGATSILYLTPDELKQLGERVSELVLPLVGRISDRSARPAGSRAVSFIAAAHPIEPTPSER